MQSQYPGNETIEREREECRECGGEFLCSRGVVVRNISVPTLSNIIISHETRVTCVKDGETKKGNGCETGQVRCAGYIAT